MRREGEWGGRREEEFKEGEMDGAGNEAFLLQTREANFLKM